MSETKHVHEVGTEVRLKDMASGTLANLGKGFGAAAKGADKLKSSISNVAKASNLSLAGMLGVGWGLSSWIEHAKNANAEFGSVSKSLASLYTGSLQWDKNTPVLDRYTKSLQLAGNTTRELDDLGTKYGFGLQETGEAYRSVAASLQPLGLSQKEVFDITEKAVQSAKAFGMTAAQAGDKFAKLLVYKNIRGVDDLSLHLKGAMGDIRKLSQAQILAGLNKSMRDVGVRADEMSKGLGDSLFKIRDTVEDLFRDTTSPLFAEIAKSMRSFSDEFMKVGESGRPMIREVSESLVRGFTIAKDASSWILKHWKEIAGVWAGMKLAKGMGGLAGGLGQGAAAGAMGGGMGMAIGASVGWAASQAAGYYGQRAEFSEAAKLYGELGDLGNEIKRSLAEGTKAAQEGRIEDLKRIVDQRNTTFQKLGLALKERGFESFAAFDRGWAALVGQAEALGDERLRELTGRSPEVALKAALGAKDLAETFAGKVFGSATDEMGGRFDKNVTRQAQININKVEMQWKFEDVDPDRVFERFKEDLENMADRRTSSAFADAFGD